MIFNLIINLSELLLKMIATKVFLQIIKKYLTLKVPANKLTLSNLSGTT